LLGYFLGQVGFLADHVELVLIGIVALSVIPMGMELYRGRARRKEAARSSSVADD
jgi:membrane-associated protein